jgi:hypothetical protein
VNRKSLWIALCLCLCVAAPALALDWQPFQQEDVVEILTHDEDGATRETKVWIVVLDDTGYVRTGDSRWLANIRRGSEVSLRLGATEIVVDATETEDAELWDRVEQAFKEKYGFMQRVMSALRTRRPTVLAITARE